MGPLVYYLPQLGGDPTGSPPFSTGARKQPRRGNYHRADLSCRVGGAYTNGRCFICIEPLAQPYGHSSPKLVRQLVPGLAAVIENVRVGCENSLRDPVLVREDQNEQVYVTTGLAQQRRDLVSKSDAWYPRWWSAAGGNRLRE
jgi:hypothetical protein